MNNKKTAGVSATVAMIVYVICHLTDGGVMP
jgi:hypothetical protein